MLKLFKFAIALALLFIATASSLWAHGGRLNGQGCHGGSRPYHCHRSASEMVPASSRGYRLKCSNGSSSADCSRSAPVRLTAPTRAQPSNPVHQYEPSRIEPSRTASPPAPATSGFQAERVQAQLVRHCSGLEPSFIDGQFGPNSKRILRAFQQASGLTADGRWGPKTAAALAGSPTGTCSISIQTAKTAPQIPARPVLGAVPKPTPPPPPPAKASFDQFQQLFNTYAQSSGLRSKLVKQGCTQTACRFSFGGVALEASGQSPTPSAITVSAPIDVSAQAVSDVYFIALFSLWRHEAVQAHAQTAAKVFPALAPSQSRYQTASRQATCATGSFKGQAHRTCQIQSN